MMNLPGQGRLPPEGRAGFVLSRAMGKGALVLSLVTGFSGEALSEVDANAREALEAGEYLQATELARYAGDAENLAFASEVLCYYGLYVASEEDRPGIYEQAIRDVERALELDPDSVYVQLQAAHAFGRFGESIGVLLALQEGIAERMRKHLDAALVLDPDNPLTHAMLGGWNLEIVARAGAVGAFVYGASKDEGHEHFRKAVQGMPDHPGIRDQYARSLLNLGGSENEQAARMHLETAMDLPARNRFMALQKEAARKLFSELP